MHLVCCQRRMSKFGKASRHCPITSQHFRNGAKSNSNRIWKTTLVRTVSICSRWLSFIFTLSFPSRPTGFIFSYFYITPVPVFSGLHAPFLFQQMLIYDPALRVSAKKIIHHRFFDDIDRSKMPAGDYDGTLELKWPPTTTRSNIIWHRLLRSFFQL